MASSTPDVAEDLMQLAATIGALSAHVVVSGAGRSAWSGPERPSSNSGFPVQSTFWEATGGGRTEISNDGRLRSVEVQVLVRGKRLDYATSLTKAIAIADALDLYGPFVGSTSSRQYIDVVVGAAHVIPLGPGEGTDAEYFAVNFEVTFAG
jgi:hypothetical protein